ncbi:MAG: cobalamin-binding protein [Pseudomonadales bacterium]|nr:cobalamin-binding protein [Pseudomonadales bacterium]
MKILSYQRVILFAFLCMLLSVNANSSAAGNTVIDAIGNEFSYTIPARRIISLTPHITELVYAAGAGAQLVGVVAYSDYPPQAQSIRQIGSFNKVSLEQIAAVKPDLILAWSGGNSMETISRLKSLGFRVHVNNPDQFEDIAETIRQYGLLTGFEKTANQAASQFLLRYASLLQNQHKRPKMSVFYEVWNDPLLTINGQHLISRVISLCGGKNIFADAIPIAPKISIESVLKHNPQVIIASGMDQARPEWLDHWQQWPTINAVKNSQLYFIPPDLLQRHTPRILDGAEQMCDQMNRARKHYLDNFPANEAIETQPDQD